MRGLMAFLPLPHCGMVCGTKAKSLVFSAIQTLANHCLPIKSPTRQPPWGIKSSMSISKTPTYISTHATPPKKKHSLATTEISAMLDSASTQPTQPLTLSSKNFKPFKTQSSSTAHQWLLSTTSLTFSLPSFPSVRKAFFTNFATWHKIGMWQFLCSHTLVIIAPTRRFPSPILLARVNFPSLSIPFLRSEKSPTNFLPPTTKPSFPPIISANSRHEQLPSPMMKTM